MEAACQLWNVNAKTSVSISAVSVSALKMENLQLVQQTEIRCVFVSVTSAIFTPGETRRL